MKLLFDHQLSPLLVDLVAADFPGSVHVSQVRLAHAADEMVWNFARTSGYVIVTKDGDFHDLGMRLGFPPFVVLVKRGNCRTAAIRDLIERNKRRIISFVGEEESGVLILF